MEKTPNVSAPFNYCQVTEISTIGPTKSLNKKSNNSIDLAKPQQSICPPESTNVIGHFFACPNKMGDGENEPSQCSLQKVMIRSKDVPLKSVMNKCPRKSKKIPISQEVYIDYTELLNILSDPLYNSTFELALAEQLTEVYKDYDASGNADSYEILCEYITTL